MPLEEAICILSSNMCFCDHHNVSQPKETVETAKLESRNIAMNMSIGLHVIL